MQRGMAGLAVGLALTAWLGVAPPARSAETGSFLRAPVRSLGGFLSEVRKDAALQKRYGKHLSVPWREVPQYLSKRLRAGRVQEDAPFTVYNVTSEGEIYPTKQVLKKGTPIYRVKDSTVFFTAMGDPARPFFTPVVERTVPAPVPAGKPEPPREELVVVSVPSD